MQTTSVGRRDNILSPLIPDDNQTATFRRFQCNSPTSIYTKNNIKQRIKTLVDRTEIYSHIPTAYISD